MGSRAVHAGPVVAGSLVGERVVDRPGLYVTISMGSEGAGKLAEERVVVPLN